MFYVNVVQMDAEWKGMSESSITITLEEDGSIHEEMYSKIQTHAGTFA